MRDSLTADEYLEIRKRAADGVPFDDAVEFLVLKGFKPETLAAKFGELWPKPKSDKK